MAIKQFPITQNCPPSRALEDKYIRNSKLAPYLVGIHTRIDDSVTSVLIEFDTPAKGVVTFKYFYKDTPFPGDPCPDNEFTFDGEDITGTLATKFVSKINEKMNILSISLFICELIFDAEDLYNYRVIGEASIQSRPIGSEYSTQRADIKAHPLFKYINVFSEDNPSDAEGTFHLSTGFKNGDINYNYEYHPYEIHKNTYLEICGRRLTNKEFTEFLDLASERGSYTLQAMDMLYKELVGRGDIDPPVSTSLDSDNWITKLYETAVLESISRRDIVTVNHQLVEETGELAKEIAIEAGFNTKSPSEDGVLGEACDVIIAASDILFLQLKRELGKVPTLEEFKDVMNSRISRKVAKWNKNAKSVK